MDGRNGRIRKNLEGWVGSKEHLAGPMDAATELKLKYSTGEDYGQGCRTQFRNRDRRGWRRVAWTRVCAGTRFENLTRVVGEALLHKEERDVLTASALLGES